jgi:NarL family two-component system response regulator LiaR
VGATPAYSRGWLDVTLGKVSSNGGSELNVEEPIRVVIADDQRLFANGLARIIGVQPDMEVVGEAHTGEEAISLCLREEPDVVLMDLSMPGMGGLSATRKILSLLPRTRVLILTVHTDDAHVFQGIEAGAQGYILKDCTPEDLTRAIRAVHAGDTIMSQDIARKMLTTFEGIRSNTEITPNLTERELQVIMALAQGKSNKEIARDLDISEKTVRNHASNIYKKLHIFDRTQAVIYAIREGLVDLEDLGAR